jgi:hypothetical protein
MDNLIGKTKIKILLHIKGSLKMVKSMVMELWRPLNCEVKNLRN